MTSKALVYAIALASLGTASLSFAQDHGRNDRRGRVAEPPRVEQRGPAYGFQPRHDAGPRGFDRHAGYNDRRFNNRGPQFHRGDRLPPSYRQRGYAVNSWQSHRLHAPAHGQQWVQVGTDYALIAIATGVIAQLVLGR